MYRLGRRNASWARENRRWRLELRLIQGPWATHAPRRLVTGLSLSCDEASVAGGDVNGDAQFRREIYQKDLAPTVDSPLYLPVIGRRT